MTGKGTHNTTKGSWKRPTQRKKLAELGEQIWRTDDQAERERLIREWHWVNSHWDDYQAGKDVYEDIDFENLPNKAGSMGE